MVPDFTIYFVVTKFYLSLLCLLRDSRVVRFVRLHLKIYVYLNSK